MQSRGRTILMGKNQIPGCEIRLLERVYPQWPLLSLLGTAPGLRAVIKGRQITLLSELRGLTEQRIKLNWWRIGRRA